jgi:hypothetical protein
MKREDARTPGEATSGPLRAVGRPQYEAPRLSGKLELGKATLNCGDTPRTSRLVAGDTAR